MRYALAIAIGVTFAWCGAAPPGPVAGEVTGIRKIEGPAEGRLTVFHDDDRGVTCWLAGAAITCLADSAFAGGGYR